MTSLLSELTHLVLFFFALYGWGALFLHISNDEFHQKPFFTASVGMAFLIFAGGLLNALNLAYASTLNVLIIAGLLFSAICLSVRFVGYYRKKVAGLQPNPTPHSDTAHVIFTCLTGLTIFTILGLLLIYLIPSSNYNFHDDLLKYIPRPVRMLQSGTLGGDPFDAIGIDSLGAQAFLNAFSLAAFDLTYFYAFDSIFCFTLCALLLLDVSKTFGLHPSLTIIPVSAMILINPQSVNISSLYSGSLLTIALILSLARLNQATLDPDAKGCFTRSLPAALITAAIVCLKITFLPFVFTYIFLYFLLSFYIDKKLKRGLLSLLIFGLASFSFILPWILVHFDHYSALIHDGPPADVTSATANGSSLYGSSLLAGFRNQILLFSISRLFYGGSFLAYTSCVIIGLLVAIFFCTKSPLSKHKNYFPAVGGAILACAATYFFFPFMFPADLGIRYSIPILIAVFSVATVAMLAFHKSPSFRQWNSGLPSVKKALVLFCFLIPLTVLAVDFSKLLSQRIGRIIWHQTTLSFPLAEHRNYKTYNDFIFSDTVKRFFVDVQNSFQEGSTILAWVSAPFHFNYARNTIFSVGDASGLNAPWLNLPVGADDQTMRDFFLRKQIKYIIWEYKGYGMRTRQEYRKLAASPYVGRKMVGENGLFMYETFEKLVNRSRVIFSNARIIVCELENP